MVVVLTVFPASLNSTQAQLWMKAQAAIMAINRVIIVTPRNFFSVYQHQHMILNPMPL
jgi:hypothetical protein